MNIEETRKRLEAIEKKMQSEKSKQYYYANREKVLARMKMYDATHLEQRRKNAAKYRQTAKYAKTMIRYWTKKLKEIQEQEDEHTSN